MITLKFPRHHSMSVENQSSTNQSSYRHLLLPLAVCTRLELISTHSPHSRIGTGFLTYFMLIWMLRIVHTDHGSVICQDEKKEQTMMQTVFLLGSPLFWSGLVFVGFPFALFIL